MLTVSYDRALVLFNAANAALAAAPPGGNPILTIGGQQMAPLCHNALQQTVLALPGRNVSFVRGRITPQQLMTHRPSYVNALLIQSRGVVSAQLCTECSRRGLSPFPDCVSLPATFRVAVVTASGAITLPVAVFPLLPRRVIIAMGEMRGLTPLARILLSLGGPVLSCLCGGAFCWVGRKTRS
jgi:hypothetical protein